MKSRIVLLVCMVGMMVCWPAAGVMAAGEATAPETGQAEGQVFRSISPQEAMRILQTRDDIAFLDVRTPKERSYGAIPGSQLVSFFELAQGKFPLPKDRPVMLVCAVGGRSYTAGKLMAQQGYQEVYNVSGGIRAWYKAGLPVVQDPAYSGR